MLFIKVKISILTPTYNRGSLLNKLYNSIVENKTNEIEIEWLIMDDGSTDNTKEIVHNFIKKDKIDIKYFKQENTGKMQALNNLVKHASKDLIIECDSDDYFTDNAFSLIAKNCQEIDEKTYALCYLKSDQNNTNMGNLFKKKQTTMFDLYFKQGEIGEKALVFNSKIRKQYKHELENNEKFVTEARMYHKMDKQYEIKCFNEPIMICEYKKDGYSKNLLKVFKDNPFGYYKYFYEMFDMPLNGIYFYKRLYIIKHYILFSVLTNNIKTLLKIRGIINKLLIILLYIPAKIKINRLFSDIL